MDKKWIALLLALSLLLCGCQKPPLEMAATTLPPETTAPTTEPVTEPATLPPHSRLYDPEYPVEDVIRYFNEVCLDAEITNSGDPSLLQKWVEPIRYYVYGDPTAEDTAILEDFIQWLNTIEGFPGMEPNREDAPANLRIHFCTREEMLWLMGPDFEEMDGAVTFWYENDQIYDAIICIRTDLDQHLRNSVIQEELYNALGPIQDTSLREDSIIYAGYSEPQQLTAMDELILKLLYHPDLECGMTARQCEEIIRQLYY